jgi:DNA-binding ferritin-like protein (Dps family)
MSKILDKIIGDFGEKKRWRAMKARAKALPSDYAMVYEEIQHYLWNTGRLISIDPFDNLLDLFEEAAAAGRKVIEITGDDVAAFADELVRDEKSYLEDCRKKLNRKIATKIRKAA